MLIGVDICNTIANVNYELLQKFNINLKQYPAPEVPVGYFESTHGLEVFINSRPFFRAPEILHRMNTLGNRLVYVTSRPRIAGFVTRRWLAINGFPNGRVEFVGSKEKAVFAQDVGISMFFDDDPTVIKDLIEIGMKNVFVKNAPYNQFFVGTGINRFDNWNELSPYLERLARL